MIGLGVISVALVAALFLVARRLHQARGRVEQLESRLASVLSRGGVGLSIWSPDGRLTACNEKFREHYPDTPLKSGLELEDLLRFTATRGLVQVADESVDAWVAGHLAAVQVPRREIVRLADGRWLAIDIGPTDRGEIMMLFVDVTAQHAADAAVAELTAQVGARAGEVEVLRRVIDLVGRADTIDAVAPDLVKLVCEWTGWAVGLAYRVDALTGQVMQMSTSLCVTSEAGEPVGAAISTDAQPEPEGLVHRVLQSRRVTWVAHLESDPTFSAERRAAMAGILGACGVPVLREGRVVAVLEFLSVEPLAPSPSRTALLESIGVLLGMTGSAGR